MKYRIAQQPPPASGAHNASPFPLWEWDSPAYPAAEPAAIKTRPHRPIIRRYLPTLILIALLVLAILYGQPLRLAAQRLQNGWQRDLAAQLQTLRQHGDSAATWLALCGLGFLYGILHAAGPGHGKAIIATFTLSQPAARRQTLAIAIGGALLQGVSAILWVALAMGLLHLLIADTVNHALWLNRLNALLVAAIGAYILWRHRPHRHHAHCACHPHGARPLTPWAAIIAIGIRPCSGAVMSLAVAWSWGIAAAGIAVAKHGNRAASSKSGAADCLEALGVNIDLAPETCTKLLKSIGLCFMFAQKYHTSMKYVGAIRKELGIRTVFNILGPLTNPARPERMILGVYDEYLLEPLTRVLIDLGVQRGMVIYGTDCLDEISISAPTKVSEFKDGWYKTYTIAPEDFGLKRAEKTAIVGGMAKENAAVTRAILTGAQGAKTDIVLLNAGAAIYIGGKADSIKEGVEKARTLIESGAAEKKLQEFIKQSNA